MGSFVAQAVAERAPRRVSRLVLAGVGAEARESTRSRAATEGSRSADRSDRRRVRSRVPIQHRRATGAGAFMDARSPTAGACRPPIWKKALSGLMEYRAALQAGGPHPGPRRHRDAVFSVAEQTGLASEFRASTCGHRGRRARAALGAAARVRATSCYGSRGERAGGIGVPWSISPSPPRCCCSS